MAAKKASTKWVIPLEKSGRIICTGFFVPCCPQAVQGDAISAYLDGNFGRGLWMYGTEPPCCEQWDTPAGNCEAKFDSIKMKMSTPAPVSQLRRWLVEAKSLKDAKKHKRELERILDELPSPTVKDDYKRLKRDTLFEMHGRMVANLIDRGMQTLGSRSTATCASIGSRFLEYRMDKRRCLEQVLNDDSNGEDSMQKTTQELDGKLRKASTEAQKAAQMFKWMCKHDAGTARYAKRQRHPDFSQTGSTYTESDLQRQEKVPHLTHLIMDKLYPKWKEGVIILHQALQEQHCDLSYTRKDISMEDLPALATDIANRVEDFDRSKIQETTMVHLSLALVGWAEDMSFYEICVLFELHNLKAMKLDYKKFNDAEVAYREALRTATGQADKDAARKTLDQALCISPAELRLQNLEDSPALSRVPSAESIDAASLAIQRTPSRDADTLSALAPVSFTSGSNRRRYALTSRAEALLGNSLALPRNADDAGLWLGSDAVQPADLMRGQAQQNTTPPATAHGLQDYTFNELQHWPDPGAPSYGDINVGDGGIGVSNASAGAAALDTLANVALQNYPPLNDEDSGYGGSTSSTQYATHGAAVRCLSEPPASTRSEQSSKRQRSVPVEGEATAVRRCRTNSYGCNEALYGRHTKSTGPLLGITGAGTTNDVQVRLPSPEPPFGEPYYSMAGSILPAPDVSLNLPLDNDGWSQLAPMTAEEIEEFSLLVDWETGAIADLN